MSQPVQVQVFRGGQLIGHVVLDGSKKVNKIGKTSSSQIKLDDPQASRVHAVIETSRKGAWLIDMGSATGTLLNGARVNKAQLNSGDQITIGTSTLVVTMGGQLAQAQMPPQPMQTPSPAQQVVQPQMVQQQPLATPTQPQMAPLQQPQMAPVQPQPQTPPPMQQPPMQQPQQMAPLVQQQVPATPSLNDLAGQGQQPSQSAPMAFPQATPQGTASSLPPLTATPQGMATSLPPLSAAPASPPSVQARPAAFGPGAAPDQPVRDTDSSLSETDPAVIRLQASARRNRLIGAAVLIGVVVVTAVFVWLGTFAEGPDLKEASNYSEFGVDEKPPTEGAPAEGTSGAATETASGPTVPTETAKAGTAAAFDIAEARDEAGYLYTKLAAEHSFAALSERYYGSTVRAQVIAEANPLSAPNEPVASGTEVRVPRYWIYEVKPGDSLGAIAKQHLGDAMLYEKLFEYNKDVLSSPTAIDVGMKLKIPIIKDSTP